MAALDYDILSWINTMKKIYDVREQYMFGKLVVSIFPLGEAYAHVPLFFFLSHEEVHTYCCDNRDIFSIMQNMNFPMTFLGPLVIIS